MLAESRSIAIENLKDNHKANKKRFDQNRSHHNFQPGQRVWYNWHSINDTKLTLSFKGPFVIEHPVGKVFYKITRADASNKKKSRIVHVQSIKPAQHRPNLTIQVRFNLRTTMNYITSNISHRQHPRKYSYTNHRH